MKLEKWKMLNFLTNPTYRECTEKIQLLKTPEERERRLKETPSVHFDPKMNPDYESDDTEEYFNKEHGIFNSLLAYNNNISIAVFNKQWRD